MRVTHRVHGDDGISAVISVISLFGILTALLLSLDAGNVWQTRRAVVTATDATALEQARRGAIYGPAAACSGWEATVVANAGTGTEPISCTVVQGATPNTGYVTVEARKPVAVRFGGVYGQGDTSAFSSSSARWGYITQLDRVRPIAMCGQNEHVAGYLGTGVDLGIHPSPAVHRVMFTRSNPLACGNSAPGNWGFIDFDGGSNSNGDLRNWLEFGWSPTVAVGDCDAAGAPGTPCGGDPGSSGGSVSPALDALVRSGMPFPITIFDSVTGTGSNVGYNVSAFLGVILRGYRVTGPETMRYLDLEFTRITTSGNCCLPAGQTTGVFGLRLCGIDHDARSAATRCTT